MKRIIILEGPDGGGKTTLGLKIGRALGAEITNHGPYRNERQIWRHYFESMLPALADERHVILDRCWIAEPIYGAAYRGGANRIEPWQEWLLERIAERCSAIVVYCLPPVHVCVEAFRSRREDEMLDHEGQLRDVHLFYEDDFRARTSTAKLNVVRYDYTSTDGLPSELLAIGVAP